MSFFELKNDSFENESSINPISRIHQKKDFEDILNFPLIKGKQCLYVLDWRASKITFSKGVEEFLGYTKNEMNPELIFDVCHPDDRKFVMRIIKGVVFNCTRNQVSGTVEYMNITFRVHKKDGTMVKILRQSSTYQYDKEGRFISSLSLLTDITFIKNINRVEWDIYAKDSDVAMVKESVFK